MEENKEGASNADLIRQQMSGEQQTVETTEEVVVTPPQAETSTENKEEEVVETPTTETPQRVSDDDVFNYFKQQEQFKDISSIEDVYKQKEVAQVEQPQYDSQTQDYLEFNKATNKGVDEYMKLKSLNVENMTDKEFAIYSLKKQAPHLSDSDADFLYNNKYNKDADIDDEATVRMASIDLQNEVLKGKALVDSDISLINTPQDNPQTQQNKAIEQANNDWNIGMDTAIDTFNKPVQVKLDDDITLDYSFNDNQKEVIGAFKDMNTVGQHFANDKGEFDYTKFTQLIADGVSAQEKISLAFKQGIEKGKLTTIQNRDGVGQKAQETPPSSNGTNAERLREQLRAKGIRT